MVSIILGSSYGADVLYVQVFIFLMTVLSISYLML